MATNRGRRDLTIEEARRLARHIDDQQEQIDAAYEEETGGWSALVAHAGGRIRGLTPSEIARRWETGVNAHGAPLNKAETAALVELWCGLFGCLPPDVRNGTLPTPAEPEPQLEDLDMMSRADVARRL